MVVTLLQLLLANFTASTMPSFRDLDDEPRADTPEELETAMIDTTREKEILGKAVTGILILMLKWFRVSRIPFNLILNANNRCFKVRVSKSTIVRLKLPYPHGQTPRNGHPCSRDPNIQRNSITRVPHPPKSQLTTASSPSPSVTAQSPLPSPVVETHNPTSPLTNLKIHPP